MKQLSSKWAMEQLYYSEIIEKNIIKRPDFQRLLDEDRIIEMIKIFLDNIEKYDCLHTIEEIVLAISPSCTWVIDGQHRLECFKILHDKHNIDVITDVRSIKVKNEEEANYWFSIVNKACPMPQLPSGMMSYAKPNELYLMLMEQFPQNPRRNKKGLFDNNVNVREPRMCKNTFITRISIYIKKQPITNEEFIDKVIELNNSIRIYVEKKDYMYFKSKGLNWRPKTFNDRFHACLEDCGGFCLGLFRRYDWIKMIFENKDIMCTLKKKTTIPAYIKRQVWRKYHSGILDILCPICKLTTISADNFEAGHIISEYNGGKVEIDNLKPICNNCNKSMGTKNMS